MSHLPQRKEKNCLNCGTTVIGKYCHVCGQENIEPKESVWHLISHFFNDITHFDGKFFTSLKDLIFRPGFLSKEYMNGKRVSYLNPIRMYLFTSFVFFLIFFSAVNVNENGIIADISVKGKTLKQINELSPEDFDSFTKLINHGSPMTRDGLKHYMDSISQSPINFFGATYKTRGEYDSLLKSGARKDNWIVRQFIYKGIEINQKYRGRQKDASGAIMEGLMHHFPQMLFISLPFAALFLKLLYARRKKFYYVSHVIFTVHFYVFVFIIMLLSLTISKIEAFANWNWLSVLNALLSLIALFYLYKAMRNFYEQKRAKTIVKYFILLTSFFVLSIVLFLLFFFVSIFQV